MNNKPAFPIVYPDDTVNPGMTLRDYFAAKAMQGLITNCEQFSTVTDDESLSVKAYKIADAMLAEREKTN